jgi:hypothetical protein
MDPVRQMNRIAETDAIFSLRDGHWQGKCSSVKGGCGSTHAAAKVPTLGTSFRPAATAATIGSPSA